jgi:hypothetical protein
MVIFMTSVNTNYNEKITDDCKFCNFFQQVYQQNIHDKNCEFLSVKKVMTEMGGEYAKMEIASFLSISKGYLGE